MGVELSWSTQSHSMFSHWVAQPIKLLGIEAKETFPQSEQTMMEV